MGKTTKKKDKSELYYEHCKHCLVMSSQRKFRKGKDICKECEDAPGYIYLVHNEVWPKCYKVGITEHPVERLRGYNSACPHGDFEYVLVKGSAYYAEIEKEMLIKFFNNRTRKSRPTEWLCGINDVNELIDSIEGFHEELKILKELGMTV